MKNIQTIDDFFIKLDRPNMSYNEMETYVLTLLEHKLKKSKKKLLKFVFDEITLQDDKRTICEFDGIAPDGIDDLEGPTIVEFKTMFSSNTLKFLNRVSNFYPKYKSLLLIIGSPISYNDSVFFHDYISKFPKDFKIRLWDTREIIELSLKYKDESSKIVQNLGKKILDSTFKKAINQKDWKEERDILINNINQSFKNDDIVFFIGAGVSKDAGLPNWDELLRSLNISIIESKVTFKLSPDQKEDIVKLLTNLQIGAPLVSASYISKALNGKFVDEIRRALYHDVKPLKEQKLLSTIAKAARPIIGKVGVRAIITYNFDDLLEQQLEEKGTDYKSIYREGDFEISTKRPIYHVHGFIPSKQDKYNDLDKSLVVFSEDGYLSLQNDPYSWSNLVQLKALRESTCVLIGLSGIDPNLRRLFSNFSKRFDGCKHYIIMQRQLNNTNSTLGKDEFNQFSNLHQKFKKMYLGN